MSTFERHVLFVDDDRKIQHIVQKLLSSRGVQCTTASNGWEALDKMNGGLAPDVIISDMKMPHMNGVEFLAAIRSNPAWTPIPFIIVTGHRDRQDLRQALMLGADDYLEKPLDQERLLLAIYSKAKRAQELTRYAEAAHETLGFIRRDMARMFTHELRTPLVSVNMVAELLSRHGNRLDGAEARDLMDTLQTGITRLNRLVEQMVLLVQLDTGELPKYIKAAATPGPLWDALTAAVSEARAFSHRQRDILVEYNDGGVGGEILAEWKSLRHALAEVLSNAMAFSPKDQPVIVSQWLDEECISISITDIGPGIPSDQQKELFHRFKQLERETHDQQGVGIGLYLARSIVEANGGKLMFKSNPGEGTTVTVRFPLANG